MATGKFGTALAYVDRTKLHISNCISVDSFVLDRHLRISDNLEDITGANIHALDLVTPPKCLANTCKIADEEHLAWRVLVPGFEARDGTGPI